MTNEEVDYEIGQIRAYVHALIDVRFSMRLNDPQKYYLWRTASEFHSQPGAMFQEAVRIHDDGTWTWQPTAGVGHVYSDVVMYRTYRYAYGARHSETPWLTIVPKTFKRHQP